MLAGGFYSKHSDSHIRQQSYLKFNFAPVLTALHKTELSVNCIA
jgi:hypothetical protein